MRFSSIFQLPVAPRATPARELASTQRTPEPAAPAASPAELPEDLDARVRLVGEWQLGEGY
jgi:hypothetical protein